MRMSSLPRARTLLAAAALIVGALSSAHAVSFTLAAQSGDTWTYTLSNTGDLTATAVIVTDSVAGVMPIYQAGDNGDGEPDSHEKPPLGRR